MLVIIIFLLVQQAFLLVLLTEIPSDTVGILGSKAVSSIYDQYISLIFNREQGVLRC